MGWGRWLLLGDLGQQMDLAAHQAEIERLKEQIQSNQAVPSSIEHRLEILQRENDELKLYLAAVIRLMLSKKLAPPDEIKTVVAAVDREDGTEDKKFSGPMLPDASS
jgi:hypothetical protein